MVEMSLEMTKRNSMNSSSNSSPSCSSTRLNSSNTSISRSSSGRANKNSGNSNNNNNNNDISTTSFANRIKHNISNKSSRNGNNSSSNNNTMSNRSDDNNNATIDNAYTNASQHVSLTSESACERYSSCRWTLAYLGSAMTLLVFLLRHCISMAVVCIANLEPSVVIAVSNDSTNGTRGIGDNGEGHKYIPADVQGVVLSSYYYGYVMSPFVGGMIAERFGGKRVLTVAMVLSAILTLLTPLGIRYSAALTVVFRVLLGLSAGVCVPSVVTMWSHWAPKGEKAKLLTITFAGSSTGSIVAYLISGFLCGIPLDEGWPFIFYVYGAVTLLWVVAWQWLAYDTPEQHPRMRSDERAIISSSDSNVRKKAPKPPLKAIFTSPAFLSLLMAHVGYSWMLGFIATYLPIYLNDVMSFDTDMNGVLSSVPFVVRLVMSAFFAVLSDHLNSSGRLSVTKSRKLFHSIGCLVPAAVLIGVGYLDPAQGYVAVSLMVVVAAFQAACMVGFRINHLDIAPRFAGSISGITVSLATIANIICPLIISPIIADKQQGSWKVVFFISSAITAFSSVLFAIFGSGEEQDWAKEKLSSIRAVSWVVTPDQEDGTPPEHEDGDASSSVVILSRSRSSVVGVVIDGEAHGAAKTGNNDLNIEGDEGATTSSDEAPADVASRVTSFQTDGVASERLQRYADVDDVEMSDITALEDDVTTSSYCGGRLNVAYDSSEN